MRLPFKVPHSRVHTCAQPGGAGSPEDEPEIDVDQLANMLSRKANEMRDEIRKSRDEDSGVAPPANVDQVADQIAGMIGTARVEPPLDLATLQELGPQLRSDDFELLRLLGRLDVRQVTEYEDPTTLAGKSRDEDGPKRSAVVAYLARLESGRPYEGPVVVLFKEYLNGFYGVALNELRTQQQLFGGLPGEAEVWRVATEEIKAGRPVSRCLGFFLADASEEAENVSARLAACASDSREPPSWPLTEPVSAGSGGGGRRGAPGERVVGLPVAADPTSQCLPDLQAAGAQPLVRGGGEGAGDAQEVPPAPRRGGDPGACLPPRPGRYPWLPGDLISAAQHT